MKIKQVLAATLVSAACIGTASASPSFTAQPGNLGGAYSAGIAGGSFSADYIAGNYSEVITLTPANATSGSFAYSLLWQGTAFQENGANIAGCGVLFQTACTGLGSTYSMFATLQGVGTYSASGSTVSFIPALGGSLSLMVASSGLTITAPVDGFNPYGVVGTDVRTLLTGTVIAASGELKPGVGNDFGSFGTVTTAALTTPDGENFFTAPRPFFDISFEAGNFNNYWLGAGLPSTPTNFQIGGGAQITFGYVPEPSALALAGLALLGLGLSRRRSV